MMGITASPISQQDPIHHQNSTLSDSQVLFDESYNRLIAFHSLPRDERIAMHDAGVDFPDQILQSVKQPATIRSLPRIVVDGHG